MNTSNTLRPVQGPGRQHGYKVKCPLQVDANHVYIPLGHGKVAIVDREDFDKVDGYNWHLHADGYAVRGWLRSESGYPGACYLHRWIAECPIDMEVDHVDGDPLNNRRSNLRMGTHRDNLNNRRTGKVGRVGFKGVRYAGGSFTADVQHMGKHYHLGSYATPEFAWIAASIAREHLHGPFANHGADPFQAAARKRFGIG